jgi:hypothetical protein
VALLWVDGYVTHTRKWLHFKAGCHHIYVQAKKNPKHQWLPTQYKLMEEEMGHIMVNWDEEWKIPPVEIGPSEKKKPKLYEVNEDE